MTTIAYDRPIKDFVAQLSATGHVTHVKYKKKSVTLHHNGGRLSLQGILDVWKVRPASAHFQSDGGGALGQYVHVQEYAWAVGNTLGNQETISIEMANSTLDPTWRVADATWKSAARLAGWLFANVIDGRPRPTRSNFFVHHHWKSTDCAGPFIDANFAKILLEVQSWYDFFTKPTVPTVPGNEWEDIMALFNTKDEYIQATRQAVLLGTADYFRAFFKDEAGTGDTIMDDVRDHFAKSEKLQADTLTELQENTRVTRVTSNNPSA